MIGIVPVELRAPRRRPAGEGTGPQERAPRFAGRVPHPAETPSYEERTVPRNRTTPSAQLSPLARRIVERGDALGLRQADIARRAALSPQVVSRLLCGQQVDVRDRQIITRLAHALKTTPEWLEGMVTDPAIPTSPAPQRRMRAPAGPRPSLSADDIAEYAADALLDAEDADPEAEPPLEDFMAHALAGPIRPIGARSVDGSRSARWPIPLYAAPSGDGVSIDAPTGLLPRPLQLIGRPDAYAVVAGAGAEPRYRPHEILYVAVGLMARDGDWVVAITRVPVEGKASRLIGHIGRLVRVTRARMILSSENGRPETVLASQSLEAAHPIVLSGEADLTAFDEGAL